MTKVSAAYSATFQTVIFIIYSFARSSVSLQQFFLSVNSVLPITVEGYTAVKMIHNFQRSSFGDSCGKQAYKVE